jgi:regulator of protease activity HflC (stomatin/prohibitin superfamily)
MRRRLALSLLVTVILVVFLAPYVVVNIPVGSAGVLWHRFSGTDFDRTLRDGISLKWPWDIAYTYSTRLQSHDIVVSALTADGLNVSIAITYRWFLNKKFLPHLHNALGPTYAETLLLPEVNAATRRQFALIAVRDYYGTTREQALSRVFDAVVNSNTPNYICSPAEVNKDEATNNWQDCLVILADVLVRDVELPPRIVASIQSKIEQQQLVQEMQYRVERERYESDRKLIEAEGIRKFQETVQSGISDTYLKWRGIEATVLLATSPNAKTVIIGGANGLPLILNTGDSNSAVPTASAVPSPSSPITAQSVGPVTNGTLPVPPQSGPSPSFTISGSLDVSRPDLLQGGTREATSNIVQGAWSGDLGAYTQAYKQGLVPQNAPLNPMNRAAPQSEARIGQATQEQGPEGEIAPQAGGHLPSLGAGATAGLFSFINGLFGSKAASGPNGARPVP